MISSEIPSAPHAIAPAAVGFPPILYDASRLSTRVLNVTPNGIDRLDALLARGVFQARDGTLSALVFGWGGPRLLTSQDGLAALERAERLWDEDKLGGRTAISEIGDWLAASRPGQAAPKRHIAPRRRRIRAVLQSLRRIGVVGGADPVERAPRGAVYLNATHFPLEWPSHVAWLDRRPDVRLTLLVHDLLPLDQPAFFWSGEADNHRSRLALLARRGAAAIVTTQVVAERLREEMARAGRRDLVIHQATPPVAPVFHEIAQRDGRLEGADYFITCGTIEPRKNQRLLFHVWRQMAERLGARVPKLIVIGKRGWLCEDIVKEMHHPALAGHVLEVSGLTSSDYKHLLDHARALLAPTFAEGFGLPVAEALTAGTPVIASDIEAFREQGAQFMQLIDPMAAAAWLEAIQAIGPRTRDRASNYRAVALGDYLESVAGFVRRLT